MRWTYHNMIAFTGYYLFSHRELESFFVSLGALLPDFIESPKLTPLFLNRPRLPHTLFFWILTLGLIFAAIKALYPLLPDWLVTVLPTPLNLVFLLATGICSHLLLDAFSDSPIIISGSKKIALDWYSPSAPSEDNFAFLSFSLILLINSFFEVFF